jgi:hypothetical protein
LPATRRANLGSGSAYKKNVFSRVSPSVRLAGKPAEEWCTRENTFIPLDLPATRRVNPWKPTFVFFPFQFSNVPVPSRKITFNNLLNTRENMAES